MSVLVGSARIDENGRVSGGKAGDQTGNEVGVQNWYLHPKGWDILRPNNPYDAEKIAYAMEEACTNSNIGYDQSNRDSLYNLASKVGFNPGKVKTPCETDCSALVRVCCAYAGIKVGNFNTSNEKDVLMATGKFTLLPYTQTKSEVYAKRGDILVTRKKGHTVICLGNGSKIKPVQKPTGGTYMFEVSNVKHGSTGNSVLLLQEILRARGFKGGNGQPLSLDGQCGDNTVFAINAYQDFRRKSGVELGTNNQNDSVCGPKMWKDMIGL